MPITDAIMDEDGYRAEQALAIGTVLSGDQFTITEHLGAGGFGITYRATDNVLGRTIVLKECFPEDFCYRNGNNVAVRSKSNEEAFRSVVKMFMREARSLAKLRHPNIVGVHRAFEENDTAYMVLDLIDGIDLFDILDINPDILSARRVTQILLLLLDAIEEVHGFNLLHRDISPDNIIIEDSGAPVLIDFGAARMDASRHTRAISSLLVVKDGYSPPEFYVPDSDQTVASDLYSLAATFYHVVSGSPPPDSQSRMVALSSDKPDPCVPLAGRFNGYPDGFLRAIDEAMRIHPSDRLQTAAKWRSMIAEAVADGRPVTEMEELVPQKSVSLDFEVSLSQLVAETNVEVSKSRAIPVEPVEVVKTETPKPKPAWIEEFNRESMTPTKPEEPETAEADGGAEPVGDEGCDADAPAKPTRVTSGGTDWIEVALEKQERLVREQQEAMERELEEARSRRRSSKKRSKASDPNLPDGEVIEVRQPNRVRSLGISVGLLVACYYAFSFYFL